MSSEPYRSADRAGASRAEAPDTRTLASIGTPVGPGGEPPDRPPAPESPVFLPSEVVAGRFRVVRLLGRGGMGEIYEVEDLELGERVAIKTLRPRLAASDSALALFRNEIQLARRVTHPNVCRTFDAFRHRPDGAREGVGVVFLTMELLPGETLSCYLRREGPLSLDHALPLVRQVAAGLGAAHAAGIVHRDFKSGNVLLAGGERGAVVTDFGLAGAVAGASAAVPSAGGTEPYRAPEQAAGRQAGPAADLHALGVVVLEMLTGRLPPDLSPAEAARESGLPPEVVAVLCRCLAPRPEQRPRSAMEVHRALERAAAAGVHRRRRHLRAAAAALVALLPLLWLGLGPEPPWIDPTTGPAAWERSAVLHPGLVVVAAEDVRRDRPGCGNCLPVALAELLKAELEPRGVEVLEPVLLYGVSRAARGVAPDAPRPQQWADLLGAHLVVEIETVESAPERTGATSAAARAGLRTSLLRLTGRRQGHRQPLFRFVHRSSPGASAAEEAAVLVPRVAEALDGALARPRPGDATQRRHRLVGTDPAALALYVRGVQAFGEARLGDAADLLGQALEREPDAFRILLLRAEVLRQLTRDPEALTAIRRAHRLARHLGEAEQLEAETVLARVSYEYEAAARHLGELVERRPGRIDWRLLQGNMYLMAGQPKEARRVIEALEAFHPPSRRDPRVLLYRGYVARELGDTETQLRMVREAQRRSTGLGLVSFAAWGRMQEADALARLGRFEAALPPVDAAVELFRDLGHRRLLGQGLALKGRLLVDLERRAEAEVHLRESLRVAREEADLNNAARCLSVLAGLRADAGDLGGGEALYQEALSLHRQRLDPGAILRVRYDLLGLRWQQGHLDEVGREARELLAKAQGEGDRVVQSAVLELLGRASLETGDLAVADHFLERAESASRRSSPRLLPTVLRSRALLHLHRDELPEAREAAERAVEASRQWPAAVRVGALEARGAVEEGEGRLEAARQTFRSALRLARGGHELGFAAILERRLGRVELRLGRTQAARERLTAALSAHRRSGAALEAAHAHRDLAELYLATGEPRKAAAQARQALEGYSRTGAEAGLGPARDLLSRAEPAPLLARSL